jgi:spermidine/putrescine transport system permease protein
MSTARPSMTRRVLKVHLVVVYAFLYVPIAVLVLLSFNRAGLPTVWTGFSLDWYAKLASAGPILSAAKNSVLVAVGATLISTILGTMLAFGLERGRPSGLLEASLVAPMIIPDIVMAIALLTFYTMLQATLGLVTIIVAHAVFNIAFVAAVVRARLKNFDFSLIEASADLGAGPVRTFVRVVLPQILPGVVAAALLAFTLSFDEFIIAYFTAGPGSASTTLPMQIYAMIRFGVTPEINALATVVLAVSVLALIVAQRLEPRAVR